jgi:hypothetical protein
MISAGNLTSQVAERSRDQNFEGTSQSNMILLASYAQQVINAALHDVVASASLTLTPRQNIYQLSSVLPSAVKVLAVRDASGRDLQPMYGEAEEVAVADLQWLTAVSDAPRNYGVIGRDLLFIYPGVRVAQTLTVFYSELTPTLALTTDTTVVPNEDDDAIFDLVEALLLLKNRDLLGAPAAIARFRDRIQYLRKERR